MHSLILIAAVLYPTFSLFIVILYDFFVKLFYDLLSFLLLIFLKSFLNLRAVFARSNFSQSNDLSIIVTVIMLLSESLTGLIHVFLFYVCLALCNAVFTNNSPFCIPSYFWL